MNYNLIKIKIYLENPFLILFYPILLGTFFWSLTKRGRPLPELRNSSSKLPSISMIIHIKNSGAAGYRSRYLSHAKQALYHLSYRPSRVTIQNYLIVSETLLFTMEVSLIKAPETELFTIELLVAKFLFFKTSIILCCFEDRLSFFLIIFKCHFLLYWAVISFVNMDIHLKYSNTLVSAWPNA